MEEGEGRGEKRGKEEGVEIPVITGRRQCGTGRLAAGGQDEELAAPTLACA